MGVISSCCRSEENSKNSGTSVKDDDEDDGFMETPIKSTLKLPLVGGPPSTTKLDRLGDRTRITGVVMQEINAILQQYATDPVFQRNLQRPAVQEGNSPFPIAHSLSFSPITNPLSIIPPFIIKHLIIGKDSKKMAIIDMISKQILVWPPSILNYDS